MNIHKLNCLLLEIFFKGDTNCFEQLYRYTKPFMIKCVKKMYRNVKDKKLNTIYDVINESWLNLWLYTNEERVLLCDEEELNSFILSIVTDTIIEINNKELAN